MTAPAKVTAQFKEPLLIPGDVVIRIWEMDRESDKSIYQDFGFQMQQHRGSITHMVGMIHRG